MHASGIGMVKPGQDIHQGALAGAVFAQKGMDFPRRNCKGNIVKGDNAGKGFPDILDMQQL